jgi:hypothetical protein
MKWLNKWVECDECKYICINIHQVRDKETGLLICNECNRKD